MVLGFASIAIIGIWAKRRLTCLTLNRQYVRLNKHACHKRAPPLAHRQNKVGKSAPTQKRSRKKGTQIEAKPNEVAASSNVVRKLTGG
jgi:hypothetical protein